MTEKPVEAAVRRTVPELWVKAPPVLRKDPPTAKVPLGSVVVPLWKVMVLEVVALLSVKEKLPVPAIRRL